MTRRHRRHSTAKKREVVEACLNGEALQALSERHDVCRSLIRTWIEKHERGACDDDAVEADLLSECKVRIVALERLVGRQALEIEFP
ncbi:MAG: transposase [Boseongicola sp.]|nr:transposase [Boseongicola sp.]